MVPQCRMKDLQDVSDRRSGALLALAGVNNSLARILSSDSHVSITDCDTFLLAWCVLLGRMTSLGGEVRDVP
jgi:phosphopantetheinyl transferase (holo-ACP synthase)